MVVVMADVDITSLSVEISAESQGAELNIDKLAAAISNLRTKGNVAKVCSSLDKLSASISALKSASTGLDGLSKITSFMNGLANVDLTQSAKGIRSVANALNKISSVNLGNMDFSGLGSKMNSLKNGLSPISSISDSSIKSLRGVSSAINSIAKIPSITKKLDSKTLDDFAEVCKKVASAISPLASKLDKVGRSFSSLPSKIKSAVNSTTRFSSANQKASTSLSSLASQLEAIKKRAAQLVSLKAIATYLANAVTKFNDFYEATDLFNNAMGELSGQATELINKMESLLGIDPTEAMTNIATIQSLATSFGLASDKAYILSKNLTQLAYDESSYWNKDAATTFTAIASAISGELEPIRRLGVDLSQARLQQELLALGFNKQVSSLSQADKAVLRYIAIMKQTTNIQGNLAQTISSPANMVRILKSEISQLAKAVGQLLYPAFKAILPVLIAAVDLIKEFVVSLASVFGQKIEFTDFSKTQKDIGGVTSAMDDTADATKAAAKAAKDYTMGFDELNIIDPSQNSGSSGSGSGGAAGNLLGDVDLSQYDMFKDYAGSAVDEIKAKLKSLDSFQIGTQIGEQLNKLMGMIYNAIHSIDWASLGAFFADGVNGLVDSVDWDLFGRLLADRFIIEFELLGGFLSQLDWTSVLNAFIDGFSGFFHELSDWIATVDWTGVGKQLTDKLSDALQNVEIEKLARVFFNFITDSINAVSDFLAGTDSYQLGQDLVDFAIRAVTSVDWAGLAQAIGRFFGEAFIEALDFMGGLVSRIADYFEKKVAEGPFNNVGLNIVYGIYYGIQDAITNVASWIVENVFNPFINGFKSAFGINSPSTVMAEQGGYIIAGLKKGITDAISSVAETAKKILSAIKSAFDNFSLFDIGKNLIQGLIDGVNNMIETAKNAVANVGNAVIDKVKNVLGIHSPSTVFAEIGGYIVQGLANGINAASPYVEQAMTNLANVVQQKGNEMIDYGADVANGFVDNMVNTFDAKWNEIDNGLKSDFIGTIKGMIDAVKKGDIQTVAENTAAIIWKAMGEENRKQVKSYASDLVSNLTSALKTVGSKAFSSAKLVGKNILDGITSKFGEISTQVVGLGSKIASSFSSLIGPISASGKAISIGLSSGVLSQFPSIIAGIAGLIGQIGAAFMGILQTIGSVLTSLGIPTGVIMIAGGVAIAAAIAGIVGTLVGKYGTSSSPSVDNNYSSYPGTSDYDSANDSNTSSGSYYPSSSASGASPAELRSAVHDGCYNAFLDIFQRYGDELTGGKELKIYLDGKQITASVEKRQSERGFQIMGDEVYSY
nr:MAG TPA: minor tail protein [Caudoviricetes sp.]